MSHYAIRWLFTRPALFGFLLALAMLLRLSLAIPVEQATTFDQATTVGTGMIFILGVLALWLTDFDEPHNYDEWRRLRWFTYATMVGTAWVLSDALQTHEALSKLLVIIGVFVVITYSASVQSVPRPGQRLHGEPPKKAYLVVTIDLRQQPPALVRAAVFSCKGSSLTQISQDELNLDVDSYDADSYEEARSHLLRQTRLYYPRLAPLLERSGETE